jgi:hypothetical protein
MSDILIHRNSTVSGATPTTDQIELGEIQINTKDGKVFFAKSGTTKTVEQLISVNSTIDGNINFNGNVTANNFIGYLSGTSLNSDKLDGFNSTDFATVSGNTFNGNQNVVGNVTANNFIGYLSGTSLNSDKLDGFNSTDFATVSGNTFNGNQNVVGNVNISKNLTILPSNESIDTNINSNVINVKNDTGDLLFTKVKDGILDVVNLKWLEGNLYTGLLSGGLISATVSGTTFNISAGTGIVVTLNTGISKEFDTTIKYVKWNNITNIPLTYLNTHIQSFIAIDSNGNVVQSDAPYYNGQYNSLITIGTVIHQNLTFVNSSITYPNTAYGYKQRTYDFIKAFGPLKLNGLSIIPTNSLGLNVSPGTAWADGRNYQNDPNNPSYITDTGTTVSKIFKYYQLSGNTFIQDTNNNLGYTTIDPTLYNLNGVLTPVPGTGSNRKWSIQRVFWYPNSATKGIVVYYGNKYYNSSTDASANNQYEEFYEIENTKQNAVYLGAIVLRNDAVFTNSTTYLLLPAGIFRSVGGSGGGGGIIVSTKLQDLNDVAVGTIIDGDLLYYNHSLDKWVHGKSLTGNFNITGDLSVTGNITGIIPYSGLTNIPTTIVTGSTQIYLTGTTGFSTYIDQPLLTTSNVTFNNITSNKILIGTTTDAGNNSKLQVSGLTYFNGNVLIGTTIDNGYKLDVSGTTRTTGNSYFATVSGNVGIGTTSPSEKLNVTGNILASGTILGNNLSGTNTGDNAINSLYSGLTTNATHTGDVTGSTVLTLATVNSNVGSFGTSLSVPSFTVNAKGLITGVSGNTIPTSNTTTLGLLSATDWNTFNNKQSALTNPVTGTGTANYLTKFTGTSTIGNSVIYETNSNILIGTTTDITSAIFNITSTTKGFLPPRMTTIQKNAISSPATGLTVYDTDYNRLEVYNGSAWVSLGNVSWGSITGTLSGQTDLQNALNLKQNQINGTGIVKANGTTISYDNNTYLTTSSASSTYAPLASPSLTGDIIISPLGTININADASSTIYQRFKWYVYNPSGGTIGANSKLVLETTRRAGFTVSYNPIVINQGNVGINVSDLDTEPSKTLSVGGDIKLTGQFFVNTSVNSYTVGNVLSVASGGGIVGVNLSTTYAPINNPTFTGTVTAPTITNTLGGNFATTSGNVGIGTQSPLSKLHVNGFGTFTSGIVGVGGLTMYGDNTSATGITLLTNGNLGIGTSSPSYLLDISKSVGGGWVSSRIVNTSDGAASLILQNGLSSIKSWTLNTSSVASGDFDITQGINSSGTSRLYINSSGNIGIGTTSPLAKLDTRGDIHISDGSGIKTRIRTGGIIDFTNFAESLYANATITANTLSLLGNNGTGIYVNTTGNVGIGTTTPAFGGSSSTSIRKYLSIKGDSDIGAIQLATGASDGDNITIGNLEFIDLNQTGADKRVGWISMSQSGTIAGNRGTYLRFATKLDGGSISEQLRITSNGNVGIGTSIPGSKLEINGVSANSLALDIRANGTTSQSFGARIYAGSNSSDYSFRIRNVTDTQEILYIRGDGNLGIGTSSPLTKLHINSSEVAVGAYQQVLQGTSGGYGAGISFQSALGTSGAIKEMARITSDGEASWSSLSASTQVAGLRFYTTNNGTTSERLRINGSGNVGIGTTSPQSSLHNNGQFTTGLGLIGNPTNLQLISSSSPFSGKLLFGTDGTGWKFGIGKNQGGTITDFITINDNGNIGIGTTAPNRKLEVGGTEAIVALRVNTENVGVSAVNYSQIELSDNSSVRSYWRNLRDGSGATLFSYNNNLRFLELETERIRITSGGNVGIGTTTPNSKLEISGGGASATDGAIRLTNTVSNQTFGIINGIIGINNIGFSIRDITNSIDRIVINGSGNIGIGTSAPGSRLQISGVAITTAPTLGASTGGALYVTNTDTAYGLLIGVSGSGSPWLQGQRTDASATAYSLNLQPSGGNVLIGTSTDSGHRLNVSGAINVSGFINRDGVSVLYGTSGDIYANVRVIQNASTTNQDGMYVNYNSTGTSGAHLRFFANGTNERMRIDASTGNVGIGYPSPSARLDLYSATDLGLGANGIRVQRPGSYGQYGYLEYLFGSSNTVLGTFYTGGGASVFGTITFRQHSSTTYRDPLTINSDGNVGIGTSSPLSTFNVAGTSALNWVGAGNSTALATIGTGGTTGGSLWINTASLNTSFHSGLGINGTYSNPGGVGTSIVNIGAYGVNSGGGYGSALAFITTVGVTATERMRIFSNGNVGIGTQTDNGYILNVNGASYIGGGIITTGGLYMNNGQLIYAKDTLGSYQAVLYGRWSNDATYLDGGTGGLYLRPNNGNVNAMYMNASGNVGIGTTAPSYKLDISGSGIVTQRIVSTDNQANFSLQGTLGQLNNEVGDFYINNNSASGPMIFRVGSTVERMRITSTGNVGIGTSTPSSKLHVKGNLIIGDPTSTVADNYIRFYNSSGTVGLYGALYCSNGNVHLDSGAGAFPLYLNYYSGTGGVVFGNGASGGSGASVNASGQVTSTLLYSYKSVTTAQPLVRLETTGTGGRPYMDFRAEGSDLGYVGFGGTSSNVMYMMHYLNSDIQIGTSSLVRMAIKGNGNVTIGSTTDNGYKLDVTGTLRTTSNHINQGYLKVTNGIISGDNGRFFAPQGASYVTQASVITGAFKIKLPVAKFNSGTMIRMTIKIYTYNTGRSYTFDVGGYNLNSIWYNTFATSSTDSGVLFNVRFGIDATSNCIWIGELATAWDYPQVYVTDFQGGFAGSDEGWSSGWSITTVTAFDTVTTTRTSALGLNSTNNAFAYNLNQNLRTTDSPTFSVVNANINGNLNGEIRGAGGLAIQSTTVGTSYGAHYQIREKSGGASLTGFTYAPALAFHWAGIVASSIALESSGRIAIMDNPGTGYQSLIAQNIHFTNYLFGNGKQVFDTTDSYLRLNQTNGFTSGIYTPYNFRADGTIYVGGVTYYIGAGTSNLNALTLNGVTNSSQPANYYLNGAPNDPYGGISVTNPTTSSYSYYGLTRQGNIGMGMGINTSNQFFIGTTTAGGASSVLSSAFMTLSSTVANFSGTVNANINSTNITSSNYFVNSGENNGLFFWGDSTNYTIKMGVTAATYQYGPVTDYSMRFTFGGGTSRGFTWGYSGNSPIAALNAFSGNMQIAGIFTEASSIRYKEDIKDLTYSLDDILKLRGVTYKKKGTSHVEIGVIAEEVNNVIPELVTKNQDGSVESVSYGRLSAIFIEAFKQQQEQIELLKQEINLLKQ